MGRNSIYQLIAGVEDKAAQRSLRALVESIADEEFDRLALEARLEGLTVGDTEIGGSNIIAGTNLQASLVVIDGISYTTLSVVDSPTFAGSVTVGTNLAVTGNATVGGTLGVTGAATLSNSLTLSTMTAGSVLFAGTAGLVSQDNANLFWDNPNNRLGVGTAAPSLTLDVRSGAASTDTARIQSTVASGYSSLAYFDSTSTGKSYLGFGNGSAPDSTVRNRNYWRTLTADTVLTYGAADPSTIAMMLFAADGNVVIGPSSTNPNARLSVRDTVTNRAAVQILNTSASGYSAIDWLNSSAAGQGATGYGNATVGLTHLRTLLYCYSGGPDWVFANATKNNAKLGMTNNSAFLELAQGDSAAVSASNTGRIRYNVANQAFQVSLNGAAYVGLPSGSGTVNTLPKWTSTTGALGDSIITDTGSVVTIGNVAANNTHVAGGNLQVKQTAADTSPFLGIVNDVQEWRLIVRGSSLDQFIIQDATAGKDVLQITKSNGRITSTGQVTITPTEVAGTALTINQEGTGSSRAFTITKNSAQALYRIAGGSDELLQIGGISGTGLTTMQLGPTASATPELTLTTTAATFTGSIRNTASSNNLNTTGGGTTFGYAAGTAASALVQVLGETWMSHASTAGFTAAGVIPARVIDTTSMAQGVGGAIAFHGNHTGITSTTAALIKALKANGTAGNVAWDLALGTRAAGSSDVAEVMRLGSDRRTSFEGGVVKRKSPGSFTIPTDYGCVMADEVILTGTQEITIEGDGALAVVG